MTQSLYQQDVLRQAMENASIIYHWAGIQLGEHREASIDSQHIALKNSLQAYADYMQTESFERAIVQLEHLARISSVVIMAESINHDTCHRSLIADYLLLRGAEVVHLGGDDKMHIHELSSLARRESIALVYDRL